jgi:ABC-type bacteriocin/lantibiotic exporter with double-glycine peptidase domain
MVLAFHGMNVDPQRLNHFLTQSNGYTERGWLHWEAAAEYEQGKVRHAYWNLLKGNPLIDRIRRPEGGTHFVLVVGKEGWDYIAQDPGAGGRIVRLSEFNSDVEALRFYERL